MAVESHDKKLSPDMGWAGEGTTARIPTKLGLGRHKDMQAH